MGEATEHQPYRVLIVEDSATIRYAYKLLLDNDYDVLFAEDPLSKDHSRELASGQTIKKMDGLDVCAAIKRSPFKATPIIMVTSRDGLIDKMRGKFARADRYLTKPVDQNDLKRALNDVLSRKTVARRLKNSPYMEPVYTTTAGEEA